MKGRGNNGAAANPAEGEKKSGIDPELWHACAGPLVSLPPVGSLVVYFPQGHIEQVSASLQKDVDAPIPNYPSLPSKLICSLPRVTLHADAETDEVYAQMTLQPVKTYDKEALLASALSLKSNKPQPDFFCKTLTASDTSTHGGFSVPRRAAEKILPPLDFTMQPPAQELQFRDLHDNLWTFRHIYRGQPKRHLLTTGWSLFVSGKHLSAGDSVLFIRDEKSRLLLGIRRAKRQPTNLSSSVLSSDSMHIGILAAAAHAVANNSSFTVFYNPRASLSEFVIPLTTYNKAIYGNQISLGMRFWMMFEIEEFGTRRYMGTITGISDLDPVRWRNSQWRNLEVDWDESAAGESRDRVSLWEIEPVAAPFLICPSPFFGSKRPTHHGMPDESTDVENLLKKVMPWLADEICIKDSQSQISVVPGISPVQWMNMQQTSLANTSNQPDYLQSVAGPALQNTGATVVSGQMDLQAQVLQQTNIQFGGRKSLHPTQQFDQFSKLQGPPNLPNTVPRQQPQHQDVSLQQRQQLVSQTYPSIHTQNQLTQPQIVMPSLTTQPVQSLPLIQNHQPTHSSIHQNQLIQLSSQQRQQYQQPLIFQHHQLQQQQNQMQNESSQLVNQQTNLSEQIQQRQYLHQQQQQQQPALLMQQPQHIQDQLKTVDESTQHLTNSNLPLQQHGTTQIMNKFSMEKQISQPLPHQIVQKPHKPLLASTEIYEAIPPTTPMDSIVIPGTCTPTSGGTLLASITSRPSSCSLPPSANNGQPWSQMLVNKNRQSDTGSERTKPTIPVSAPGKFNMQVANPTVTIELQKAGNHVKPPFFISNMHIPDLAAPQSYLSSTSQMDQLDSSSSATSVCLSQNDGWFPSTFPPSPFNQTMLFRGSVSVDENEDIDPGNSIPFGASVDGQLGLPLSNHPVIDNDADPRKDCQHNLSAGNMLTNYSTSKQTQQDISSSIVSQSFGVPDVAFNSIDSNINDSSFLNKWAPTCQVQRMRTYTKVYKRGAVGRSIDISRYSGYRELRQDLARMFSIEGKLEDRQRIGWKLVYVDHENDVLLVGDDPWEEFVSCVRCIRILSPQEVQQMSFDGGDLGANITNHVCSSSDGINAWRGK